MTTTSGELRGWFYTLQKVAARVAFSFRDEAYAKHGDRIY